MNLLILVFILIHMSELYHVADTKNIKEAYV